jgi:hypothetical protein
MEFSNCELKLFEKFLENKNGKQFLTLTGCRLPSGPAHEAARPSSARHACLARQRARATSRPRQKLLAPWPACAARR